MTWCLVKHRDFTFVTVYCIPFIVLPVIFMGVELGLSPSGKNID